MRLTPLLAASLMLGACHAPLGAAPEVHDPDPGDFDLAVATSLLPGVGGTLALSQRMLSSPFQRTDVELDWTRQAIDEAQQNGRTEDTLNRVRAGLRVRFGPRDPERIVLRAGVAWMRAQGDTGYLDRPGDYGGLYLGVAYELAFAGGLTTGPGFVVHVLDSEGSGDSGWVPELSWNLTWGL